MEHQLFIHCESYLIIICRRCKHAVWPTEIERHLKGKAHQLKHAVVQQIKENIEQWDNVARDTTQLTLPTILNEPIPELPIQDGYRCQRDPQCQYVAGNMNTMRKHWQNKHSWSPYPSRGRTAPQKRTAAQDEVDRSCQKVQFQQIFASRKGSHYIQIQTKETTEHTGTPDQNRASQAIDELERFYQEQQRQTSNVIQAGEHDEANPWLRRTRWPVYLTNIAPNDLVNCVQRPDDDTTCPDELAARAIWEAMGQVARTSQRVITRLGHFVRIEAIRTERHQTRHTPLQAYMDYGRRHEHVPPYTGGENTLGIGDLLSVPIVVGDVACSLADKGHCFLIFEDERVIVKQVPELWKATHSTV
ncbi:predicted protein, partial [Histoplasma mississippiense (nom. inval.)]|uniref:predicted protein n=1 Tax=Ajellomyces capsulatus (strain NAm1 / WU24) TaxID=2059318 RepID=UPI000157D64E